MVAGAGGHMVHSDDCLAAAAVAAGGGMDSRRGPCGECLTGAPTKCAPSWNVSSGDVTCSGALKKP